MTLVVLFGCFATALLLNAPVGIALGTAIITTIVTTNVVSWDFFGQVMVAGCDSFPLMAIPFFVLTGLLMEGGGLSRRLVNLAKSLVGFLPGGLAYVTVLACMFFGAISGSGPATVAAIGSIMIPAMVKNGYSKDFSTAISGTAGSLGVIVPPSIPMVMYGVCTGTSVSTLFLGGFIPGLLMGLFLCATSYFLIKKGNIQVPREPFSLKGIVRCFYEAIWALIMPLIILGGIYGGVFTPTEAAVVAVWYGIFAGIFIYKELTIAKIYLCLRETVMTTGAILIILGCATIFSRILSMERVPQTVADLFVSMSNNSITLLILINIFLLGVGCVLDTIPAIIIIAPILTPVVVQFGIDPVHFGLLMVVNLAIGFLTPPVGINIFVASGISGLSIERTVKAFLPFVFALLIALILITYIPWLTLVLPKALM